MSNLNFLNFGIFTNFWSIFKEFLSTQNVNVARFARNVGRRLFLRFSDKIHLFFDKLIKTSVLFSNFVLPSHIEFCIYPRGIDEFTGIYTTPGTQNNTKKRKILAQSMNLEIK